jgi:hypothetical protein
MINLGQMPRGAMVALQMPVFALVGALSSVTPEPPAPPASLGGGGWSQSDYHQRQHSQDHPEELLEVLEIALMHNLF